MQDEKRFYVYVHKLKETGEIFYVGKGSRFRLISRHGRPKAWHTIVNNNEWVAEKVLTDLSNDEAVRGEVELINKLQPICNTHYTDLKHKAIPASFVKSRFKYDPHSESGLVYATPNGQHGKKKRVPGDPAGVLNRNGYYAVSCGKSGSFLVHRIIWFLVKSEDPGNFVIDHIDGDRANNIISNLRKVTAFENSRNAKHRSDNTSGVKGVFVSNNFCIATWVDNTGTPRCKNFSCKKYGKELAFALAVYCRCLNTDNTFTHRHKGFIALPSVLNKYSTEEILAMLNCDKRASNSSGYTNISLIQVGNHGFWNYTDSKHSRRFSVKKYGDSLALSLCLEYKNRQNGEEHSAILGFSINETNSMLSDNTGATNKSGFKGLSFRTDRDKTVIVAQKMINRKNYSKTFNCDVLGLIQAHALASEWYEKFNKEDILCQ